MGKIHGKFARMGALMATPPPAGPRSSARPRHPLTRADIIRRLLITVVVLACIGGLVLAVQRADTGEPDGPAAGAPDIIEFLVPAEGSEIPEDQLVREPAQNIVEYRPGEGQVIEQLPPGRNCAQVITWRVNESRERARAPVEWCFEVT
jgi:hypothetical protein